VASCAGDRLDAAGVADLADEWLASPAVVPLVSDRPEAAGPVIRRADGRVIGAGGGETLWTTPEMLSVEHQITEAYARGRHRGAAVVSAAGVDAVVAARPTIGVDQAAMVGAITTSGHRI
jgi:hypothetical protein